MKITRSLLITFGVLGLVSPADAVITYTITSAATGVFTHSGNIFDGATLIGTWTSTISGNTISDALSGTGTIATLAATNVTAFLPTANSAARLGIGIRMQPFSGTGTPGVVDYTLAYSATITAPGYSLVSSYISATTDPGVTNYGPTFTNGISGSPPVTTSATGNTNVLTFSGFSGLATLTEGIPDNLAQITGASFASGGTLNWTPPTITPILPSGDRPTADVNWFVTIPTASAQTITYVANLGQATNGVYTTGYNETTGFAFDIIPEPSSAMLLGAGVLGLVIRRRRSN